MTDEAKPEVPAAKLVKVYLKMNAKKAEMDAAYKTESEALKKQMDAVKSALLQYCKDENVESVRTDEGLFYRSVTTRYWTNDWESMGKFVVQYNVPDLFEKRLHQGNMKEFLTNNPDVLPPGLNVDSEYTITVRKK